MRLATLGSEDQYCDHLAAVTAELRARGVEVEHFHGYQGRTEVRDPLVLVASRRDARMMGEQGRKVILIEHGAGQRYHRDAGGADVETPGVILFLAPSQRVADNGRHIFPRAKRLAVGSPRVEQLSRLSRSAEYVCMTWHWDATGHPEAKSVFERYKLAARDLARTMPAIGHGHPRERSRWKREYEKYRISYEPNWAECVKVASVVTCDNSSVMWEAAALDIPVVVVNGPEYRREVDWGMRFWEYADVGPNVEHAGEFVPTVQRILEHDEWKDRRREIAESIYGQIEGSIDRAVGAIMERL